VFADRPTDFPTLSDIVAGRLTVREDAVHEVVRGYVADEGGS
jgi:hypothetical protein